jgi:anaerobic sulfite reductase subunit C
VLACPTAAWTRNPGKRYRLTLFGRSGKKSPRLGVDFLKWADEESITKVILNTYAYVEAFIDKGAPGGKEHIGYIVDRTGFEEYRKWALEGVELPEGCEVSSPMYWGGLGR